MRWRMEEKLEEEELKTLKLHRSSFQWVKKNKEIMIGQRFFDVKSWKNDGVYVIFEGLYDEEEKEIHKKMADHEKRNKSDSSLFQLLSKFNFLQSELFLIPSFSEVRSTKYFSRSEDLLTRAIRQSTPPPKC